MTNPRIACCRLPNFSIERLLQANKSLRDTPVALATGNHPTATILAVSDLAAEDMVLPGLTVARAHSRCSRLVVLTHDESRETHTRRKILRVLQDVGPFVEGDRSGICFLEAAGLKRLYGSEGSVAASIIQTIQPLGLPVTVGIASNKFVAQVAAELCEPGQHRIVPTGQERHFLNELDITRLNLSPEAGEKLQLLGLRTVRQVAAINGNELIERFGPDGPALASRRIGRDTRLLVPEALPEEKTETVSLDFSASTVHAIIAYTELPLRRLFDRQRATYTGCSGLSIVLYLDSGERETISITLEKPTLVEAFFLRQMRQELESRRLSGSVTQITLRIIQTAPLPSQQLALQRAVPIPPKKRHHKKPRRGNSLVLQLRDDFLPEKTFRLLNSSSPDKKAPRGGGGQTTLWEHPYSQQVVGGLRLLNPPREVDITVEQDQPVAIKYQRYRQTIKTRTGPWKLSGGWWEEDFDRWYYEITTRRGRMYLLYHDRLESRWFVQGVYD